MRRKAQRELYEKLTSKLDWMDRRINNAEIRLKKIECPHKNHWFGWQTGRDRYADTCLDCGKTLAIYNSEKEMLAAKLEYVKERNKKSLDAVKKETTNGQSNG